MVYFWSTSGLGRTYLTLSPIPPIYMCGEKSVMRRNFKFIHLPDVPEFNRKLYIWRMKSKVAFTMQCEKNIEIVPPKPAGRLWDDWEEYFREKNYNSWPDDVLVVTDTGPPLGPPDLDKKECDSSWHSYCRSWRSKLMSFSKNPQGFNFNTLQCHKSCSKTLLRDQCNS